MRGNSALLSALAGALFDEVCFQLGYDVTTTLWDMEKFYDNIDITKLMKIADDLGYPVRLSALGLAMHMAPRAVRAGDAVSIIVENSRGIIAGCSQSNAFARAFLHETLQLSYARQCIAREKQFVRQFVDDIRQTIAVQPLATSAIAQGIEDTGATSAQATADAGLQLASNLAGLKCKISKETTIVASNNTIAKQVQAKYRMHGITAAVAHHSKDLGVATTAGSQRCAAIVARRFATARRRTQKIQILAKAVPKASRLYNTGAMPQALYGYEAFGLPNTALKAMTALAHQVTCRNGGYGRCDVIDIALTVGLKYHPFVHCQFMQVKQWFKLLRHTHIDRVDLSRAFFDVRQKLLAADDAHR
jgi:hypothetical protein